MHKGDEDDVCVNRNDAGSTAHLCRLVSLFSSCLCDKYQAF